GLNPLELAYLAGGPNRAAATVAVGFFSAGAAMLDERKQRLTIATDGIVLPNELEPLRTCAQGVVQCKDFRAAVLPRLEPVHVELVARGLCPAPNLLTWYRLAGLVVLAVPVLIGVIRACVGAARDRPIGFLLILLMLTLFFGLLLLCPGPICTHAGTRAVRASTKTHARAVRAPLMEELALAFALTGPQALAGTPFAGFATITSGDGGGGGCGGGGGGGGGCGG
ncbi:MAG: hypothetical protein QOK44_3716, partial [Betaproteobacteria bacterium]|nr:hypothetical protein [Betaproteobacteria bacterium]